MEGVPYESFELPPDGGAMIPYPFYDWEVSAWLQAARHAYQFEAHISSGTMVLTKTTVASETLVQKLWGNHTITYAVALTPATTVAPKSARWFDIFRTAKATPSAINCTAHLPPP